MKRVGNRKTGTDRPNTLPKGEGSLSCLINSYRCHARKRKLEFLLTRDEFRQLTKGNCYYCGIEPYKSMKGHRSNGAYTYNGIDRVNSDKGYIYDNCVPCCEKCNKAKLDKSLLDFYEWVERLANNLYQIGYINIDKKEDL